MKHLKLYEDYTKKDVKRLLVKAQNDKDLTMNVGVDDILNKLDHVKIGIIGFNAFVDSNGSFISEGDYERSDEYINKFKAMGLDTSKIEKLLTNVKRYKRIQIIELDNAERYGDNEEEIDKLNDELDNLQDDMDKFKIELRKLATEANQIL